MMQEIHGAHAIGMWLERIAGGFKTSLAGDTTVRSLGAQRWVIASLESKGYINITFPYSQSAVLTVTDAGHRFLKRREAE